MCIGYQYRDVLRARDVVRLGGADRELMNEGGMCEIYDFSAVDMP